LAAIGQTRYLEDASSLRTICNAEISSNNGATCCELHPELPF
jgi:hypothetical protein